MQAVRIIIAHKKVYGSILLLFFVLSVVFVRGPVGADIEELRLLLDELFGGGLGRVVGSATILGFLVSDATGAPTEVAGLYQTVLYLLVSLAVIYVLRKNYAGEPVKIREAFYRSTSPLVPFLLVLFVVGLQLLPFAIGGWIFGTVTSAGLVAHGVELLGWGLLFFLLAILSLYMLTSSLFALYIVTLPDMFPLQALRSARELVRFRRWTVLRKILFLPLALLLIGLVLLLPVVMFLLPVAEFMVLLYGLFALIFAHAYMYSLYRALL